MSNITKVEVRKLKNPKNSLVGSGSCLVGGLVRVNFTIINGSKGIFASLPQHTYKDAEGTNKYVNDVSIPDKNLYDEFQKIVKEAFENIDNQVPPNTVEVDQTTGDGIPF